MIRLVYCVTRREDVALADFRKYWENEHASLGKKCANVLKAKKFAQSSTLAVERNARIMELRGTGSPHDGVIEMWWENARELEDRAGSPEVQSSINELFEDEKRFIDHSKSKAFFTEDPEVWDL